ncbi:AGAP007194-PA [Anopheles gambiae str. PEST]|uniref:AGAP007194-PA n=2 Tax=gambiae species complex TaxID=44542 RepID=A7URL9_ANOGA|nr:AGAP007194-PA [Anopheles gambiae str. PEST]
MKFTFAFVLIALFALFAVSQALPQPEQAVASSNDGASANTNIEESAAVEAMGGRWGMGYFSKLWTSVKKVVAVVR